MPCVDPLHAYHRVRMRTEQQLARIQRSLFVGNASSGGVFIHFTELRATTQTLVID